MENHRCRNACIPIFAVSLTWCLRLRQWRWFPTHHRLRRPRSVRQRGDEEISDGGDFGGTCASRRRHEVESTFRHAPLGENWFKLPARKVFGCDELGEFGDRQPVKHCWQK